jgi:Protein of unknown function, DUF599
MTATMTWLLALGTVGLLVGYELALALAQWRSPGRMARSAHASLREDWLDALAHQKGSEIRAVQTLRNSMMSATMTASTAVLGLMGTVTLAAPSLQASFGESAHPTFTPRLALELALLALLFASLVSSAMALRYYNHLGFISGMPVDSAARDKWGAAGKVYVRRAGILYSWGLRQLILVGPLLASILYPAAGPIAALLVIAVLFGFDRVASQ